MCCWQSCQLSLHQIQTLISIFILAQIKAKTAALFHFGDKVATDGKFFVHGPGCHSFCGTSSWGKLILMASLMSFQSTWVSQWEVNLSREQKLSNCQPLKASFWVRERSIYYCSSEVRSAIYSSHKHLSPRRGSAAEHRVQGELQDCM